MGMLMLLSTTWATAPQLIPSLDTLDTPDTPDTLDTLHLEYTVTSSTTSTTIIKQCNVNNCNNHAFKKNVMSSIEPINFTFRKKKKKKRKKKPTQDSPRISTLRIYSVFCFPM